MITWKASLISVGLAMAVAPVAVPRDGRSGDVAIGSAAAELDEDRQAHWSFRTVLEPPLPAVKDTQWPAGPIDHYILSRLEAGGLAPAPRADKRTLIRRATYDLTGLPPTLDEIHAFLADDSPDAFVRVVDRLLASPHYGERWGRHWLDVARYADSNGMDENLAYANAFRYRDYVVSAFNQDKSYREFVREQLAGDLLPRLETDSAAASIAQIDRLVATGFLTLGPKMLAEDDPVKMEMDIIDEQVDTIGRSLLGLTFGCARCHDHKFDPLSMRDYYALAGIFKSTKTMEHFKVVARWHERALGSQAELLQQEANDREIESRKSEIKRLTADANNMLLDEARRRTADYLLAAQEAAENELFLHGLKSAAEAAATPDAFYQEAENYVRGNVGRDFDGYGAGVGVIYNRGELPNIAEYDIDLPRAGIYQLELRYAAAEARPVRVLVNGRLVKEGAAARATGTWFPDTQTWSPEVLLSMGAGTNTIRLERMEPFPHIDKLALIPRTASGKLGRIASTAEQLAADRNLNLDILQQWSRYLKRTRGEPDSVLSTWHAVAVGGSGAARELDVELHKTALRALAIRYQQLFDQADLAWREQRARPDTKDAMELLDATLESLRKLLYDPKGPFAVPANPERYYSAEGSAVLNRLRDEVAAREKALSRLPEAMAVGEGTPQDLPVHLRGNHLTLGDLVRRGFPRIIALGDIPIEQTQSGRLQLADWITRDDHPLTSRVIVNRIWHWHFGHGLVRSTDNFGLLGDHPSHPELLDWLAWRFVRDGWSIKSLHRLIVLSATYQMSTAMNERAAEVDPDNLKYWRMNRRRLQAESIRDAILAVGGALDTTMGGSMLEGANRAYVKGYPNSIYDKYELKRRSIYLPVLRSMLYDVFQAFDFADPSAPTGERASTTVTPQALFALNSQLMSEQSRNMALWLLFDSGIDDQARVRRAYERALARESNEVETSRALEFVERYQAAVQSIETNSEESRLRAWHALCRSILGSSEFIYLD